MKIPTSAHLPPPSRKTLPLERCLAKTWKRSAACAPGRSVEEHCRIAGAVAAELASRLEDILPGLLPEGADVPALLHDIGKVTPPFQARIYEAAFSRETAAHMQELHGADFELEQNAGGHAAVGRATLSGMGAPLSLARIVGAHHGRPVREIADDAVFAGGKSWRQLRQELCLRLLGERPQWPDFDNIAERIACGLTVTADWIASGPLFDNPAEDWRPLIGQALDEAGFLWPGIRPGLSFEDIFSFAPRPAQKAFYEAANGPGVFVLEAPMGLGKTEAALYAAYRMLEQKKSSGIYFALPTQLTSNRIHGRVNAFLDRILEAGGSALLLHGMAWLERFRQQRMGGEAEPNQAWFSAGRRGILAPFGVGTVDQALLSVLRVRHSSLRSFGLAGKTVILDEVHSYDMYTGSLLDALVRQLRDMGCTVIILSATLTTSRRIALLDDAGADSSEYPLIYAAPAGAEPVSLSCPGGTHVEIGLLHSPEEEAVEEALRRAENGERILWIENTVAGAQDSFRLLSARAAAIPGLSAGLLHSRFTAADRERNEERWTAFLHPEAPGRGRKGGIVVGTQVVEQSLDLDADFLVSRFCPADMLLQRLGRLWRHGERTPRPAGCERLACLLHPSLEEAAASPKKAFGPSAFVYAPYVLFRSLELWHARTSIRLPEDIRPMLEACYAERQESIPALAAALKELQKTREQLRRQALLNQSETSGEGDDDNPPTRWQEREDVSLLLFRTWDSSGKLLTLADGTKAELNLPEQAETRQERLARWQKRQEVAALLARNTVRVPLSLAPENSLPAWLAPFLPATMRVARLLEDGRLLQENGSALPRPLRYDALLGCTDH